MDAVRKISQLAGRDLSGRLRESIHFNKERKRYLWKAWPSHENTLEWVISEQMAHEIRLMYNHRDG